METAGRVIDLVKENRPVDGCILSHPVWRTNFGYATVFSLAPHTGISPESYPHEKLLLVYDGEIKADGQSFHAGQNLIVPADIPFGITTEQGCVYLEIDCSQTLGRGKDELSLPIQKDKIISRDLVDDQNGKFVLMSFSRGMGLDEHAAPGQALVLVLSGKGRIIYEGKPYDVQLGDAFLFDRGGHHAIEAVDDFRMALLLERTI
jgi:quercetin dioxygenase-like cupin family protein